MIHRNSASYSLHIKNVFPYQEDVEDNRGILLQLTGKERKRIALTQLVTHQSCCVKNTIK